MLKEKILSFFDEISGDVNHRYKSWEHCFAYFSKEINDIDEDIACLHLSFYLASWGMYRGSSFLLQKDYKIHLEAVKIILKYKNLQKINFKNINKNSNEFRQIFYLSTQLKKTYKENNISDTLLTKILLGTLGCVPAYDRFFKVGMKQKKIEPYSSFSKKSFLAVIKFYQENSNTLHDIQEEIEYPIMKLIDMYFFQIGFEIENKNS